jgi:hypothetical protein
MFLISRRISLVPLYTPYCNESWLYPVKVLALSALRKNLTSPCWSESGSSFAIARSRFLKDR